MRLHKVEITFDLDTDNAYGPKIIKCLIRDNWNLHAGKDRLWDENLDTNISVRYKNMKLVVNG